MLERLRTIKVEADGERQPLRVSVGLAVWREQSERRGSAGRLRAAATRTGNGEDVAPQEDPPRRAGRGDTRRTPSAAARRARDRRASGPDAPS